VLDGIGAPVRTKLRTRMPLKSYCNFRCLSRFGLVRWTARRYQLDAFPVCKMRTPHRRRRSAANEATLTGRGFRSRIHVRAARGHTLSQAKAAAARASSMCSARRRPRRAAGWCAPSASCGRGSRSAYKTSPTTCAGWRGSNAGGPTLRSTWRADWPPPEGGRPPVAGENQATGGRQPYNATPPSALGYLRNRTPISISRRSHRENRHCSRCPYVGVEYPVHLCAGDPGP
jgi:hypothetical protein